MDIRSKRTWRSVAVAALVVMAGSVAIGQAVGTPGAELATLCAGGERAAYCGSLKGCQNCCKLAGRMGVVYSPTERGHCSARCVTSNTSAPFADGNGRLCFLVL